MDHKNNLLKIQQDLKLLCDALELDLERLQKSIPKEQSTSEIKSHELALIHYQHKKATAEKQILILDKMIEQKQITKKEFDLLMKDSTLALFPAINHYSNITYDANSEQSQGRRRTSNDILFLSPKKKKITAEIGALLNNARQYFSKRKK